MIIDSKSHSLSFFRGNVRVQAEEIIAGARGFSRQGESPRVIGPAVCLSRSDWRNRLLCPSHMHHRALDACRYDRQGSWHL
jgi:hypothetical protein